MSRITGILGVVAVLLTVPCVAQQKPYVVTTQDKKITGTKITANSNGDIDLKTDRGVMSFDRGNYKRAYQPRPNQVKKLIEFFKNKEYDKVIKYAPQVREKYHFLGWGDMIAYVYGMALTRKGKPQEAVRAIERGEEVARKFGTRLKRAKAMAFQKQGKTEDALEILNELIEEGEQGAAAFAFNTKGQIKADQGKKKEAVLEYLKTVLLFKPQDAKNNRRKAKKRAIQLLEEMGDPRVKKIRQLQ